MVISSYYLQSLFIVFVPILAYFCVLIKFCYSFSWYILHFNWILSLFIYISLYFVYQSVYKQDTFSFWHNILLNFTHVVTDTYLLFALNLAYWFLLLLILSKVYSTDWHLCHKIKLTNHNLSNSSVHLFAIQ